MKAKIGDVIDFVAISWHEPHWDRDYPCCTLFPVVTYSPNGEPEESMIDDVAFNMCCGDDVKDEDVSVEFDWRKWDIKRLKKVALNRLAGGQMWKSKSVHVTFQKIEFYEQGGDMEYRILESVEK